MPCNILLGLLKALLKQRPDLKLVIITNDYGMMDLVRYFKPYKRGFIFVPSERYNVNYIYNQNPDDDYLESGVKRAVSLHQNGLFGNILFFVGDEDEVVQVCERIQMCITELGDNVGPVNIIPIYESLSLDMQLNIFKQTPRATSGRVGRNIIVSTEISESSIWMEDVAYVIDSGYTRKRVYNAQHGESLVVSPISRASADLRGDHVAKMMGGQCHRLYQTSFFYSDLPLLKSPKIETLNVAYIVLILKKIDTDFHQLELISRPSSDSLLHAIESLKILEALDGKENLTPLGKMISQFPVDPQMGKMLVRSAFYNCSEEILSISAMLLVPCCFMKPMRHLIAANEAQRKFGGGGDHLTLLNVFNAYKENNQDISWCRRNFINQKALEFAVCKRKHLSSILESLELESCTNKTNIDLDLRKAIFEGYFMQAARLFSTGHYVTIKEKDIVYLHPSSSLQYKPKWVIYYERVSTHRDFIRNVIDIPDDMVYEVKQKMRRHERYSKKVQIH